MAIEWVVRRDLTERNDGKKHVHFLTKWTADIDRVWCTSSWSTKAEHATTFTEEDARFAAELVGGWPTPRATEQAGAAKEEP